MNLNCLCDEAMERVAGKTETCAALIQVYVAVAKATKFDIGPPTEQVAETLDNLFVLKGAFVDLNSEIFTGKSVSAPGLDQNSVLCSENVVGCSVFCSESKRVRD